MLGTELRRGDGWHAYEGHNEDHEDDDEVEQLDRGEAEHVPEEVELREHAWVGRYPAPCNGFLFIAYIYQILIIVNDVHT